MARMILTRKGQLGVSDNDISHILAQKEDIAAKQIGSIVMSPDAVYAKPWMPCVGEGGWLVENVSGVMIVVDTR